MTTFYLIRHGEKERSIGDPGLSTIGIDQAQRTATYLSQFPIAAIYTSPLLRTKQTAGFIAESVGIIPVEEAMLRERVNWGDVPGQTFEEFLIEWQKASAEPTYQPLAGDSVIGAAKRLETVMRGLAQKHKDEHVVLVTHGGIIRDFLFMQATDAAQRVLQKPLEGIRECSLTKVFIDGEDLQIACFDEVLHLE